MLLSQLVCTFSQDRWTSPMVVDGERSVVYFLSKNELMRVGLLTEREWTTVLAKASPALFAFPPGVLNLAVEFAVLPAGSYDRIACVQNMTECVIEPKSGYVIWTDSHSLFRLDPWSSNSISETLVTSSKTAELIHSLAIDTASRNVYWHSAYTCIDLIRRLDLYSGELDLFCVPQPVLVDLPSDVVRPMFKPVAPGVVFQCGRRLMSAVAGDVFIYRDSQGVYAKTKGCSAWNRLRRVWQCMGTYLHAYKRVDLTAFGIILPTSSEKRGASRPEMSIFRYCFLTRQLFIMWAEDNERWRILRYRVTSQHLHALLAEPYHEKAEGLRAWPKNNWNFATELASSGWRIGILPGLVGVYCSLWFVMMLTATPQLPKNNDLFAVILVAGITLIWAFLIFVLSEKTGNLLVLAHVHLARLGVSNALTRLLLDSIPFILCYGIWSLISYGIWF